jgi:ZIP family zinc transporter
MDTTFLVEAFVAGILASVACGLGAVPLFLTKVDVGKHVGLGYGFAGGLMFSASVYNLILPGLTMGRATGSTAQILLILGGILSGGLFLWAVDGLLKRDTMEHSSLRLLGSRREILIFVAMSFHSMPEGVAVGVGYASQEAVAGIDDLGHYIALAIAIHNIPEGLAVALPLRVRGAGFGRCFLAAFLTSLPQPLTAVPAALLVWFFQPLLLPLLGFAAGAMIFLVLFDLLPGAFDDRSPVEIAWAFLLGFCLMILVQVAV